MTAQALHMGDECHNRNKAGTSLLIRTLGPALVETERCGYRRRGAALHGRQRPLLPQPLHAGDEGDAGPGRGHPGLLGGHRHGPQWHRLGHSTSAPPATAGSPRRRRYVQGLWLPGYLAADANPDIGDSAITETGGIGGFALAGAPAIVQFVGGAPQDAINTTLDMYEICAGEHSAFSIPPLNFRGSPIGVDVRRVMRAGTTPWLNTGIAHGARHRHGGRRSCAGAEGLLRGRVRRAETTVKENHGGTEGTKPTKLSERSPSPGTFGAQPPWFRSATNGDALSAARFTLPGPRHALLIPGP